MGVFVCCSYRGYGWSEGKPTEAGIKMDSEAILNYVMESDEINSKELYIFGRSLGGAVAIHLAAKYPEKVGQNGLALSFCDATSISTSTSPCKYIHYQSRYKLL